MRIKQKEILKQRPDFEYSRVVQGKMAIVQGFHEPTHCVNITCYEEGTKPVTHCYAIGKAAYDRYNEESIDFYNPDKAKYTKLAKELLDKAHATEDPDLKVFYAKTSKCYLLRSM